jgi:hypothetical protein
MGQPEVLELLAKKDWMLYEEIRLKMKMGTGSTSRILKKLKDYKLIYTAPASKVISNKKRLINSKSTALAYHINKSRYIKAKSHKY